jgi:hypothetical protein
VKHYRESGHVLVDGCGFSEIEDAVEAVQELVKQTKRQPRRLSRVVISRADIDQPGERAGPGETAGR